MTEPMKLKMLSQMVDEVEYDEELLPIYLDMAAEIVLNTMYPFRENDSDDLPVPPKYHMAQVEIAAVLFSKRGAEGQMTHDENGVKRVYAASSVPTELLQRITPYVGAIR